MEICNDPSIELIILPIRLIQVVILIDELIRGCYTILAVRKSEICRNPLFQSWHHNYLFFLLLPALIIRIEPTVLKFVEDIFCRERCLSLSDLRAPSVLITLDLNTQEIIRLIVIIGGKSEVQTQLFVVEAFEVPEISIQFEFSFSKLILFYPVPKTTAESASVDFIGQIIKSKRL